MTASNMKIFFMFHWKPYFTPLVYVWFICFVWVCVFWGICSAKILLHTVGTFIAFTRYEYEFLFKLLLLENPFSHSWHIYGSFPVCVLKWMLCKKGIFLWWCIFASKSSNPNTNYSPRYSWVTAFIATVPRDCLQSHCSTLLGFSFDNKWNWWSVYWFFFRCRTWQS